MYPSQLPQFVAWFNQNLKGETIFTADDATIRARLRQWDHLNGNDMNDSMDLALEVAVTRISAMA